MKAVSNVHKEHKLPIATHAQRGGRKQLEFILNEGVNPQKVFISHIEMEMKGSNPTTPDNLAKDILWILEQGAYLFFGDFSVRKTGYSTLRLRNVGIFSKLLVY